MKWLVQFKIWFKIHLQKKHKDVNKICSKCRFYWEEIEIGGISSYSEFGCVCEHIKEMENPLEESCRHFKKTDEKHSNRKEMHFLR